MTKPRAIGPDTSPRALVFALYSIEPLWADAKPDETNFYCLTPRQVAAIQEAAQRIEESARI